ncbi:MAG: hypothetical protein ACREBR_00190 [bacterium]
MTMTVPPYLSGAKGDDSASPVAGEDLCDDDCTTPVGVKGGESTALLMRELKDDDREKAIWRQVFDAQVQDHFRGVNSNTGMMTEETYLKILRLLTCEMNAELALANKGIRVNKKGSEGQKAAKRRKSLLERIGKRYEVFKGALLYAGHKELETAQRVCHISNMFDNIYECHVKCANHGTLKDTHRETSRKFGQSIPRDVVELFLTNCKICKRTEKSPKPKAGSHPIVATMFGERVQMDCIDMQRFVKGLRKAYKILPSNEKKNIDYRKIEKETTDLLSMTDDTWPRYLLISPTMLQNMAKHLPPNPNAQ